MRALHVRQMSEEQIEGILLYLQKVKNSRLADLLANDLRAKTLAPVMRGLIELMHTEYDPHVLIMMQGLIGRVSSDRAFEIYLRPLFDSVLKQCNADVWLFSSDQPAIGALPFLKSRGKRIPDDISVIGFDNWREAYETHLSTFDFNMQGIMQQALLMIQDEKGLKAAAAVTEMDGYVVERRTTRR
jgi:hypothetical protein